MQISALNIKNFKKFDTRNFTFTPGINVIQGENETGKSTLLNAILVGLFTDPSTRSKSLLDRIQPWKGDSTIQIQMNLQKGDNKYKLTKNFGEKTAFFVNETNGKQLEDYPYIEKAIYGLLHIPTGSIFESTALIRQSQIAKIETSSDMVDAIQTSVTGSESGQNAMRVLKQVGKAISDYTVGLYRPAKNAGKIKVLQDEIAELEGEYSKAKVSFEKVVEARKVGKTSGSELEDIEEKIEVLEKLINNQKIFNEATKKLESIDKNINKIEQIIKRAEELEDRKVQVEKGLSDYKVYKNDSLDTDIERISSLEGQIVAKQSMLENITSKAETTKDDKKKYIYFLSMIVILFTVLGGFSIEPLLFILSGIGLIVLVTTYYLSLSDKQADRQALLDQYERVASSLEQDKTSLKNIFTRYKVANKNEFFSNKLKFVTLQEEYKKLEAEIKGILGTQDLESYKNEQITLLTEKKDIQINQLTEDVQNSKLSGQDYLRKRRELDDLQIRKRMIERQNVQSQVRVEDSEVSQQDIVVLEEQLEYNKNTLEKAREELAVLELISEGIENAVNDLAGDFQKNVVNMIEQDLPVITDNRYSDVKIEEDFSIKVFSREKNDWVDPMGNLSSGTIDQIYFLYRLALLKAIEADAKVPLLLDDTFVTFDKKRLDQTRKILEREAKDRQIMLFTHSETFSEWGNVVHV